MPVTVRVLRDGPLMVRGGCTVVDASGSPITADDGSHGNGVVLLCRCGRSQDKPFCDGSHKTVGFKG